MDGEAWNDGGNRGEEAKEGGHGICELMGGVQEFYEPHDITLVSQNP